MKTYQLHTRDTKLRVCTSEYTSDSNARNRRSLRRVRMCMMYNEMRSFGGGML